MRSWKPEDRQGRGQSSDLAREMESLAGEEAQRGWQGHRRPDGAQPGEGVRGGLAEKVIGGVQHPAQGRPHQPEEETVQLHLSDG